MQFSSVFVFGDFFLFSLSFPFFLSDFLSFFSPLLPVFFLSTFCFFFGCFFSTFIIFFFIFLFGFPFGGSFLSLLHVFNVFIICFHGRFIFHTCRYFFPLLPLAC